MKRQAFFCLRYLFNDHLLARLPGLLFLSLAFILSSCGRGPDTLVSGGYDEKEMQEAIARSRSEVNTFIAALQKGNGSDFAVKAAIKDGEDTEHFWLTDVKLRGDSFEGLIGNEPGVVSNVKFGQKWTVNKAEISDWMFMRDEKIHGNYTMRPLLKTMDKEEAAMWRSKFAEP